MLGNGAIRLVAGCGIVVASTVVAAAAEAQVHLAWDPAPLADVYYVLRSRTSGGPYTTLSAVTETTFLDDGVTAGLTYFYVVYAENEYGQSPFSNEVRAVPRSVDDPATPTGLTARPAGGAIDLDWDDNTESDLLGYLIFRSGKPGGPYDKLAFVTTSEYTDDTVYDGPRYYYIVAAIDTDLNGSPPSSEIAAVSGGTLWEGQNVGDVTMGGVFFDLDSFILQMGSGTDISGTSDEFFYVFQELDGDGEISGYVAGIQKTHPSAKGGFMMREDLSSRSKHAFVALTPLSGVLFQRRWTTGGFSGETTRSTIGPRYFRLKRSGDIFSAYESPDGMTWTKIGSSTIPMTRKILAGMAVTSHVDGYPCWARIESISFSGSVLPQDLEPPAAPSGLVGTAGDAFVDLDWADNTEHDLAGYSVYRGTTAGGPYSLIASDIGISGYTDASVENGTTYHYVVTALDTASNESTYSGESSVTPHRPPSLAAFLQDGGVEGVVSVEAESFHFQTAALGRSWKPISSPAGFSGGGALEAYPDSGSNHNRGYVENSPRLDFRVDFVKTGTHYVWVRGLKRGAADDSCHVGLDGAANTTADRISEFSVANEWVWTTNTMDAARATLDVPSIGTHTVNLWMREDGFRVDKIVLTVSVEFAPMGAGPAESPQSGAAPDPPPDPPSPPANLAATAGDGLVVLDWNDNTELDFAGYAVYRSTTAGGPYSQIASGVLASMYNDSAVTNGTTYFYVVTAVDTSSLESGLSNEASATPDIAGVDIILEAEDAVLVGPRAVYYDYAAWAEYQAASGGYIEWTLSVPAVGTYTLEFRYSLTVGDRPLEVRVNGSVVEASLSFPATLSGSKWETASTTATLRAGTNTVRTTAIGSSGGNIDHLRVTNE